LTSAQFGGEKQRAVEVGKHGNGLFAIAIIQVSRPCDRRPLSVYRQPDRGCRLATGALFQDRPLLI
jgi:hypothetical protein